MKAPVVYTGSVSSLRNARARLERIRLGANAMAAMGVGPLRQTERAAAKLAEAEFEVLMNCLACRGRVTARVRLGGTCEPGGHVCAECAAELPAAVTGALLAGHDLRADSPESMAAWTCQACGGTLRVRPDGSASGEPRPCPWTGDLTEFPPVPDLPAAVAATVLAGHQMASGPPVALPAMRRWTCEACGDAVLVRPDGSAYGAATERDCPGLPERAGS